MKKVTFYKYLAITFAVIAVLCIVIGIIIGHKVLPFIGILLICCGIIPLIQPIAKGL
jgi:hypothetical protein